MLSFLAALLLTACSSTSLIEHDASLSDKVEPLRVAISPYQDMAMLVSEKKLGLEKKYGTKLEFLTMPWEDIISAVASAGDSVDVGFANLSEYMSQSEHLNSKGDDPLLYIYPAFVFHGGAFVTFNPKIPEINADNIDDPARIRKFLSRKIGVHKNCCLHMLLWFLANKAGVKLSDIRFIDISLNDGLLAAENGTLDAAAAGLTQRTEALKRHGRVVVDMDSAHLADICGFICKESVYKRRKKDIEALIRIWCDSTNYVLSDIDHHSGDALAYLKANASTQYTVDGFKTALSQEYFPRSISDLQTDILSSTGKYSFERTSKLYSNYLLDTGGTKSPPSLPKPIDLASP
jgi:ABC-type nitrate/sulfonate/bicarbonate transport system substrate-binding protein